jgi:hypothetical protein
MRKIPSLFLVAIILGGCRKKCELASQFEVPLYIQITKVPSVKLASDTITVTASVPFKTHDLRNSTFKILTEKYKPSTWFFHLNARPSVGGFPNPPIIPFQDGYFDVLVVKGNRVRYLYFDFEKTDSEWVISFKLIPKRHFKGLFMFSWSRTQYKDDCVQMDPQAILVNTPQSHHLIKDRLEFQFSPWQDDVMFYVE